MDGIYWPLKYELALLAIASMHSANSLKHIRLHPEQLKSLATPVDDPASPATDKARIGCYIRFSITKTLRCHPPLKQRGPTTSGL
jgi:hypothetical protein